MTNPKPIRKEILKRMVKDPITLILLIVPVIVFYLIITSMPRNYPSTNYLYIYAAILIVLTLVSRYNLIKTKSSIAIKSKEVDRKLGEVNQIMREVTTLLKKTTPPVDPAAVKAANIARKEKERGDFQ